MWGFIFEWLWVFLTQRGAEVSAEGRRGVGGGGAGVELLV